VERDMTLPLEGEDFVCERMVVIRSEVPSSSSDDGSGVNEESEE